MQRHRHYWLIGPHRAARAALAGGMRTGLPGPPGTGLMIINCCRTEGTRNGHAPACSELVRRLYPWLLTHDPAGVRRNNRTFYLLAPDLFDPVPDCAADPVTTLNSPPALTIGEVRWMAHALPELLYAWGGSATGTLAFLRAENTTPADAHLIAALLHAVPADVIRIVIATHTDQVPVALRNALRSTVRRDLPQRTPRVTDHRPTHRTSNRQGPHHLGIHHQ